MKAKIITIMLFASAIFSCEEEPKPADPIYEFVSFKGPETVSVNELVNSTEAFPLVLELRAFAPYDEDIDVTLEVTGNNAAEDTDFTISPGESVTIPAGSFTSDTVFITTVDNLAGSPEPRSIDVRIKSTSEPDIRIGLGITEPKKAAVTVNILDDECSETTDVFNTSSLVNSIDWGNGGAQEPVTGVVDGNTVKVTGDLIGYPTFSSAALTITLMPNTEGATKGTASFGEQETGTDSDGYDYKFVQVGEGTYDVCSGVINVEYDIYYMDGEWKYWYSVTNAISIQ